jgi:hypothetical protein
MAINRNRSLIIDRPGSSDIKTADLTPLWADGHLFFCHRYRGRAARVVVNCDRGELHIKINAKDARTLAAALLEHADHLESLG